MAVLVVGASAATGKLLVNHLLKAGQLVKVVVRPDSKIPDNWSREENLTLIRRNVSEIGLNEMSNYLADCEAAASCLGHNLTLQGIYGNPRKLVTKAVQLLSEAILSTAPAKPFKFILMNTAGNSNRDLDEPVSIGQKIVINMLRFLLPPHSDNEAAAEYLRVQIGKENPYLQWVVVRPDSLTNEENVSEYTLHTSPIRDVIFNPGQTSRINAGYFMAKLIMDHGLWEKWKGQMPVIYNKVEKTK